MCTAAKLGMNQSVGVKREGASESAGEASGIKKRRKKKKKKGGKGEKNYEQTAAAATGSGAESVVKDGGELALAGKRKRNRTNPDQKMRKKEIALARERRRGREWAGESCSQVMTAGREGGRSGGREGVGVGLISSEWCETPALEQHSPNMMLHKSCSYWTLLLLSLSAGGNKTCCRCVSRHMLRAEKNFPSCFTHWKRQALTLSPFSNHSRAQWLWLLPQPGVGVTLGVKYVCQ